MPNKYLNDESFWEELDGVFIPEENDKDMKNRYSVGKNTYILGRSDWFDDVSLEIDSKWDAPVYDVVLGFEDNQFMGFERSYVHV